jgi:hypothetical protein
MKFKMLQADPRSVNLDRKSFYQPNKTQSPAFEAYFQHLSYLLLMKVIYWVGEEIYAPPRNVNLYLGQMAWSNGQKKTIRRGHGLHEMRHNGNAGENVTDRRQRNSTRNVQ